MKAHDFSSLWRKVRAGDPAAATELVRTYEPYLHWLGKLYQNNLRCLRPHFSTSDICQSVWRVFFRRLRRDPDSLNTSGELKALLRTMFHGKLVDRLKTAQKPDRRHKCLAGDTVMPEDIPGPGRVAQARDEWQAILAALEPEVRLLARLRHEAGLSWKEIVHQIGGKVSARRMRLFRGLQDLRAKWERQANGPEREEHHHETSGDRT